MKSKKSRAVSANDNSKKITDEYRPADIESKWQKKWEKAKLYKTSDKGEKRCYVLDMFPYPSGQGLHVGHPKGYIATDVYSRFKKMSGFNVLHPMGWDAFGLPAENYAIKNKIHPRIAVDKNIKRYKKQLDMLGFNYDWSREIDTTDPAYYKWTQWIFLQLNKKGLAYQSYEPINWCPSCQTGLANEDLETRSTNSGQVAVCERCGSVVEKKPMRQWVLKITDYADRLLADLDILPWPESIKESQRNWIGRSEGAEIQFKITNYELRINVFTTRPDTLFGVTYIVLAPERLSKILNEDLEFKGMVQNLDEVTKYIDQIKNRTEIERTAEGKEKTGVELKGITAVNPANNEIVPVWIADYVLDSYGTGAVMAVPAHDERDFEFAKKYKLPVKQVIMPVRIDKKNPPVPDKKYVTRRTVHALVRNPKDGNILCLKWKKFPWTGFVVGGVLDGEDIVDAAKREVLEETGYKNIKLVGVLGGMVRGEYYAAHKDENRIAISNAVLFDLVNEERKGVEDSENEKHEIKWIHPSKITANNFTCAELDLWFDRIKNGEHAYVEFGILINSGAFDAKKSNDIMKEITEYAGGKWVTKYKLRDWVFSRQRYWGEPIPIIHCEKCGAVPVPEGDLPVKLPDVKKYEPTGTGESPLADISKWVNVKCPKCRGRAKRETNTMPQ